MVTTRSRVKQAEAAAAEVMPDSPEPMSTMQRKRKSSAASLSPSSLSPVHKQAKTDLASEEFPRAPAPTPVAQPQRPPLDEVVVDALPEAAAVDVTEAATAAARDVTTVDPLAETNADTMDITPTQVSAAAPAVVASGLTPMAVESTLHGDVVMTSKADTEPSLKDSFPLAPAIMPVTNVEVPPIMPTTTDISALESMKEPTPESRPLPEVETVLTQPALVTVTSTAPMTGVDLNSTTVTNIPLALTAAAPPSQLSAISVAVPAPASASSPTLALAPVPAPVPAPITSSILSSGSAISTAPAMTNPLAPMNDPTATIAFSTEKPLLPEPPLGTPFMTNLVAVDPTSLLLSPAAGLPDASSSMTTTAATAAAAPIPSSVVMLPPMTTTASTATTGGTFQPQFQVPGAKDVGATTAADIGIMTNDIQPQAMPQQQVNRLDKVPSLVNTIDPANIAPASVGSNAKGPNQSGV